MQNKSLEMRANMTSVNGKAEEEQLFLELRRKVRDSELLSSSVEKLLKSLCFSGRLSVVVQNGQVLKSGYEEGYFRQKEPERLLENWGRPKTGSD